MTTTDLHPDGIPLRPWGAADVAEWRARQVRRRSYREDVVAVVERLGGRYDVMQYGRQD